MHRSVLVHDIIKTNYVTQGYIPKNYPHHLISDKEMMDGFLKYDRISYLDSLLETNPLRSDLGTYSYDPETNSITTFAATSDSPNANDAFAVYSASDNSFSFYCGDVPSEGSTYNGKVATNVYTGFETKTWTDSNRTTRDWNDVADLVTSVYIDSSFSNVKPVSLGMWFWNFSNATFSGLENIDTSNATSFHDTFIACALLTDDNLNSISNWDTSKVTAMEGMFESCHSLTKVDGLSKWDTSKVTSLQYLFSGCESLVDISGLANWNTGKVTTFYHMFHFCYVLESVEPLKNWDTSSVTNMQAVFYDCYALTSVDALNNWNVSKVTNMSEMFQFCYSLESVDLSSWNTSKVTRMSSTFYGCSQLKTIDISGWSAVNVSISSVGPLFAINCSSLEWINFGKDFVLFRDSERAIVSQKNWYDNYIDGNLVSDNYLIGFEGYGKYYTYMEESDIPFAVYANSDKSLTFYYGQVPDEGRIYNGKVATTVYTGFENVEYSERGTPWYSLADTVTSIVIDESFSSVFLASIAYWFMGFSKATFSGLGNVNTSGIQSFHGTFNSCTKLTNVSDVSTWDTSSVTDMCDLFLECTSLSDISGLSTWNVGNVQDLSSLFYNCSSIVDISALSNWDVSNVLLLGQVFYGCTSITNIDAISSWNTQSATTLQSMLYRCTGITSLDAISNWNVSNITIFNTLFYGCTSLKNTDAISNWNTGSAKSMYGTFMNCSGLETLDISNWNTSNVVYDEAAGQEQGYSDFAINCTGLDWIKIGNNFTLFTTSTEPIVSQQEWYDSDINGNTVSSNYMIGISGAGQYWTHTTILESAFAVYSDDDGSFTFYYDKTPKVGDTYNGKKVDILYDNVDEEDTSSSAPWHDIHEYVNSVSFDSTFSTVQITICAHWFEDFSNCNSINLTNLDSSNVANFSYMFANCSKVPSLDVSMLSTSSATNMSYMFYKCIGLTSLDVSTFTASKVTTMESMFNECYNLISINVDGLSTSSATNLKRMFYACENITTLDISSFNTSKVTTSNCEGFLIGCTCLDWIKISDNFDLFTKYSSRITSFKYWYDSDENGNTISENYMIGVSGAGQYWTHTTTVDKTTLRIRKIWLEDEESDRPSSVTVHIFANGVETESKTITASDNWRYYADVPKYDDDYNRITYTVTEDPLTNYKTVIDKFSIINTLVPSKDEPQTPEKIVTCGENKLVEVGEILTYRISYYNNYNEETTIIITDTLDEGVTFAYCSENGEYDEFTRTVTWKFTADAFEGGYVQLDVKVNKTAKVKAYIENTATVQIGNDTPVSSNTITNKLNDDSPKSPKKTLNSENEEINVGDELEYTISYYNHKNEATTITITETLGLALEFVSSDRSATITKNSDGTTTVKWSFTEQPFTSGTVTYKVVVTWYALYDLAITNQASIQIDSEDPVDTNTQTNTVEEPISPDYMRYVFHSGFYMDYYVEPMLRQFTTLDTEKMSEEEYTVLASMWHIGRFIADLFSDYLKGVENGTVERTIEKIYPDWVYSYMLGAAVCQKSPVLDRHDLFVLIDEDEDAKNYEDVFTIHNAAECYKISDRWLKKRTADVRPATCFGEMHVIKSLRLYHSTD